MKTKTKTLAATTMVALAVPGTALATGPGHDKHEGDRGGKSESRGHDHRGERGHRGSGWLHHGRKAFVVSGTDVSGLTVTDGKLAGPITLDPQSVSRGAAKLLDLTKERVRGEDTVAFGAAGDAVAIKYKGLTATDALLPTDRILVVGKVRKGVLDVKHVKVWRAADDGYAESKPAKPAKPQRKQRG